MYEVSEPDRIQPDGPSLVGTERERCENRKAFIQREVLRHRLAHILHSYRMKHIE
jgi:hypothetical protein